MKTKKKANVNGLEITIEMNTDQLEMLQESLLLAIEEIGVSDNAGEEDYKNAVWSLSWFLRGLMSKNEEIEIGSSHDMINPKSERSNKRFAKIKGITGLKIDK